MTMHVQAPWWFASIKQWLYTTSISNYLVELQVLRPILLDSGLKVFLYLLATLHARFHGLR
jgi:hypothetical protein